MIDAGTHRDESCPADVVRRERRRLLVLFVVSLAAIAVWRWPQRDWPPYEDAANWLWMEARFLDESRFDYAALAAQPDPATEPGSGGAYLVSIVPTWLALLASVLPSPRNVLVAHHLLHFGCAAWIVAVVATLVWREGRLGWGLACAAAVLSTPLFSAQVEMVGIELPMAAAAVGVVWFLGRRRPVAAVLASLLAFLIKATGAISTMALAALAGLQIVAAIRQADRRGLWPAARLLIGAVAVVGLQFALVLASRMMEIDQRWDREAHTPFARLSSLPVWTTDVLGALVLLAVVLAAVAVVSVARSGLRGALAATAAEVARPGSRRALLAYTLILLAGLLAAIQLVLFIPRYLTLAVPLIYLAIGLAAGPHVVIRRALTALLVAVAALNLANAHGRWLPSLVGMQGAAFAQGRALNPRASICLERSLEYRADLTATREAMRQIERLAPRPVFTDGAFGVYLSAPLLGFVSSPQQAFNLSKPERSLAAFLQATGPGTPAAERPLVLIGGHSDLALVVPPTGARVIWTDGATPPLVLYELADDFASDGSATSREAWFIEHLIPRHMLPGAALAIARARCQAEQQDEAQRVITAARTLLPGDDRLAWADACLTALDDPAAAIPRFRGLLNFYPTDPRAALGEVLCRQADARQAAAELVAWFDDPRRPLPVPGSEHERSLLVGVELLDAGAADEALAPLAAAATAQVPTADYWRGLALLHAGQVPEAMVELENVTQRDPQFAAAWSALAQARAAYGHVDEARAAAAEALRLAPHNIAALRLAARLRGLPSGK